MWLGRSSRHFLVLIRSGCAADRTGIAMKHGRYLMIGAAAAALAISGGIGSAQASAPPGWRVVFSQRGLTLGGGLGGLAATGPGRDRA